MQIAVKRRKTVRAQTAHGINERIERYRLAEQCAEFTPEVIAFWAKVLRNEPRVIRQNGKVIRVWDYTTDDQFRAADRLMDRGYGKPPWRCRSTGASSSSRISSTLCAGFRPIPMTTVG
jgi:hypothetical protein